MTSLHVGKSITAQKKRRLARIYRSCETNVSCPLRFPSISCRLHALKDRAIPLRVFAHLPGPASVNAQPSRDKRGQLTALRASRIISQAACAYLHRRCLRMRAPRPVFSVRRQCPDQALRELTNRACSETPQHRASQLRNAADALFGAIIAKARLRTVRNHGHRQDVPPMLPDVFQQE